MRVTSQNQRKRPPTFEAWRSFRTAHAALALRIGQELAERDLVELDWLELLLALAESPGRKLRMYELARIVFLSRSGLSRLVGRMTEAGLIGREQCPSDRRGTFAVLAPGGRMALRKALPVYKRAATRYFVGGIGSAALAAIQDTLDRVTAQAEVDDRILCGAAPDKTADCPNAN